MPRLTLLAGLLLCSGLLHAAPTVSQLQDGLEHPWSLAFCRRNKVCLSPSGPAGCGCGSRAKACRRRSPACRRFTPRAGRTAGGVTGPDFAASRRVYLSFAETGEGGKAGTAVGYGRLSDDGARLENFKVIFRQQPKLSVGNHFGGKLAFDRQGYLFIALGENNQRPTAQETDKLQGKLVRLTAEGAVPPDNPWSARPANGRKFGPTATAIRKGWR